LPYLGVGQAELDSGSQSIEEAILAKERPHAAVNTVIELGPEENWLTDGERCKRALHFLWSLPCWLAAGSFLPSPKSGG